MSIISGLEHVVREGEPLAPLTWFRLGGPAEFLASPTTRDELLELVRRFREADKPVRLLGGGSNVLVRDEGVPGLVVVLSAPEFSQIRVAGNRLTAGGGAQLSHVISSAVREGLGGLEPLVGIPGTVGGALHGNAGTQNEDIGRWTVGAKVITRNAELLDRDKDELAFAYRSSSLNELVILEAEFELEPDDPAELTKQMQQQWIICKSSQPRGAEPHGRIFKDAAGVSAASLIDQCGLKGAKMGEAEVSDVDPNFILAHPGSSAQDVLRLVELLRNSVFERCGVELETEIEIW